MRSATASSFKEAAKHERELNERQRHVLDLLVKGRTNGEIAEDLGITLDGAKWNVSEILGKLGLASREEAADYWRWRKRPGRRLAHALRGLATLPALKLAAGGAAAVVAVGAGVALWFALAGGGAERAAQGATWRRGSRSRPRMAVAGIRRAHLS